MNVPLDTRSALMALHVKVGYTHTLSAFSVISSPQLKKRDCFSLPACVI